MKVLITGFPGTGKSTVAQELKERGYAAYDPEAMRGYMHLQDVQTGRPTHLPKHPMRGWFDIYGAFNWDIPRLSKLLEAHDPIFICSLADNMTDIFETFGKVFVLVLDDFELEQRLRHRQKELEHIPEQLADTLTLHRHFEQSLIERGAIAISAHPSIEAIVDKILELSHDDK